MNAGGSIFLIATYYLLSMHVFATCASPAFHCFNGGRPLRHSMDASFGVASGRWGASVGDDEDFGRYMPDDDDDNDDDSRIVVKTSDDFSRNSLFRRTVNFFSQSRHELRRRAVSMYSEPPLPERLHKEFNNLKDQEIYALTMALRLVRAEMGILQYLSANRSAGSSLDDALSEVADFAKKEIEMPHAANHYVFSRYLIMRYVFQEDLFQEVKESISSFDDLSRFFLCRDQQAIAHKVVQLCCHGGLIHGLFGRFDDLLELVNLDFYPELSRLKNQIMVVKNIFWDLNRQFVLLFLR